MSDRSRLKPVGEQAWRLREVGSGPIRPPRPVDAFVGRAAELARLSGWLAEPQRLISITGPPGVGKTRLAAELLGGLDATVAWAELSGAATPADARAALCRALDLMPAAAAEDDRIGRAISGLGPLFLVLDAVEHLVGWARQALPEWLTRCPELLVVATSYHRLELPGECVLDLGPLGLPAAEGELDGDAAALFITRVRAHRPDFTPSPADRPALGRLLHRLDGLPLALELAATRLSVTSIDRLNARLADGLEGLGKAAPSRRTMQGAIAWSWELLDPVERDVAAQCSVFAGSFDLESAESVVAVDEADLLDVLYRLRAHSWLRGVEPSGGGSDVRLSMYQSLREHAAAALAASGGTWSVRQRHAQHFGSMARSLAERAGDWEVASVLSELHQLRGELQAVLRHAALALTADAAPPLDVVRDLVRSAIDAAAGLHVLAEAHGPSAEQLVDLDPVLERVGGLGLPLDVELRGHLARANHLRMRSQFRVVLTLLDALPVPSAVAKALVDTVAAPCLATLGQLEHALERIRDAVATLRTAGTQVDRVRSLAAWALVASTLAADGPEHPDVAVAVTDLRALGPPLYLATPLALLAHDRWSGGRTAEALALADEARQMALRARSRRAEGNVLLLTLPPIADAGDVDRAQALGRAALEIFTQGGLHSPAARIWFILGALACDRDDFDQVEEACARIRALVPPGDDPSLEDDLHSLLARRAWQRGQLEEAAQFLVTALDCAKKLSAARQRPILARLVALEVARGDIEAARHWLQQFGPMPKPSPILRDLPCALDALALEAAACRAAHETGDAERARAHIAAIRPWLACACAAPGLLQSSARVRGSAQRLVALLPPDLQQEILVESADPESRALVVDGQGRWLRPPVGSRADLSRRPLLVRLLRAFIECRSTSPANTLGMEALFERVWPGERAHPDALANRVHSSLSHLRSAGLGDLLCSAAGGWHIDPRIPLLRVDPPGVRWL